MLSVQVSPPSACLLEFPLMSCSKDNLPCFVQVEGFRKRCMSCTTGDCSFFPKAGEAPQSAPSSGLSPRSAKIAGVIGSLKTFGVFEADEAKKAELQRLVAELESVREAEEEEEAEV